MDTQPHPTTARRWQPAPKDFPTPRPCACGRPGIVELKPPGERRRTHIARVRCLSSFCWNGPIIAKADARKAAAYAVHLWDNQLRGEVKV